MTELQTSTTRLADDGGAGSAIPAVHTPARSPATTRPRPRRLGPGRPIPYGRLLGPLLVVAVWLGASAANLLDPRILPPPWTVAATAARLTGNGTLPASLAISLQRAGLGFTLGALAGIALALAAGLSRLGESLVDGWMQVQRSVPTLGLIPLMILWLGIGESFKVVIIATVVAITLYIQTYAGLSSIDARYVELAQTVGLGRAAFIRKVVLPGALPAVFVGLRLAVTASWLSLVVLEQINATSGIGYLMFQAQNYAQTDVIVLGLIVYGLFGFASDAALRLIEKRALSWRRTLAS
jgi:sulfonate transport system permease protein